jgi:hypothetical protein
MTSQERTQLQKLLAIAVIIGNYDEAARWIRAAMAKEDENRSKLLLAEPDIQKEAIPWMKWYRNLVNGCTLVEAQEARKAAIKRINLHMRDQKLSWEDAAKVERAERAFRIKALT